MRTMLIRPTSARQTRAGEEIDPTDCVPRLGVPTSHTGMAACWRSRGGDDALDVADDVLPAPGGSREIRRVLAVGNPPNREAGARRTS